MVIFRSYVSSPVGIHHGLSVFLLIATSFLCQGDAILVRTATCHQVCDCAYELGVIHSQFMAIRVCTSKTILDHYLLFVVFSQC